MKAIILAGGFAKRLWPLTEKTPKPLLKIGNKPVIEYIIEKINLVPEIDEIFISTNKKFESSFKQFINQFQPFVDKNISLIVEPSTTENEKLGSIGALHFLTKKLKLNEDTLIVAGDNLFEFDLRDFVNFYKKDKYGAIAIYDIKSKEKARVLGVVEMNGNRIVKLYEKPKGPISSLVSTACYLFPTKILRLVSEYVRGDNPKDAIGHFISWLVNRKHIKGFVFEEPWYDIGSFEEYEYVNSLYKKREIKDG